MEVYQKIYEAYHPHVFRDDGWLEWRPSLRRRSSQRLFHLGLNQRPLSVIPVPDLPIHAHLAWREIQYGLPIPKRVKRQLGTSVKDVTVYLHALDPEHPEDVEVIWVYHRAPSGGTPCIADYVWLTVSIRQPQGRQPRCGE